MSFGGEADLEGGEVLREACKARKLRVSLKTHRGLRTMDLTSPVNFWPYEPQAEADKAPVKSPGGS